MARVELRWPDELVARVDAAADGRPRSVWLRRLVERELGVVVEKASDGAVESANEAPRAEYKSRGETRSASSRLPKRERLERAGEVAGVGRASWMLERQRKINEGR